MKKINNLLNALIHSIKLLYYRIWGNNKEVKYMMNGKVLSAEELADMMKVKSCLKCGGPLRFNGFNTVKKYHKYCRKFRNNGWGFDINKVNT